MNQNTITCPNCGTTIDINQSIYTKLELELKKKLESEVNEHRKKYKAAMDQLKEKEEKLKAQEARIAEEVAAQTKAKLQEEAQKLRLQLKEELDKEQHAQMQLLRKELDEKSQKVRELNETKARILKLEREKEEFASAIKLEAEQQMHARLKEEKERIAKAAAEEHELKLKEKDEQMQQIKRQLEEMKRKAEQGSQQMQGEVQELAIEAWLKSYYPLDTIDEIKKGARGADCLQVVNTREVHNCGTIYYESKRTRDFQPAWIEKFKADIREKGADIGVLVTNTLPKDMERMGQKEGIWICTFEEFKALSAILREQIIRVSQVLKSQENRSDKMGLLYNYLTGNEFRMQLEAIVEGFTQMQADLQKEKNAMARIWKQREKQIMKVLENTTGMYGSIRGIAGNAIGHIDALELPYHDAEDL